MSYAGRILVPNIVGVYMYKQITWSVGFFLYDNCLIVLDSPVTESSSVDLHVFLFY
jgi:hypothetical protein